MSVGMPAAVRKSGRASGLDAALRWDMPKGMLKPWMPGDEGTAQEWARPITAQ